MLTCSQSPARSRRVVCVCVCGNVCGRVCGRGRARVRAHLGGMCAGARCVRARVRCMCGRRQQVRVKVSKSYSFLGMRSRWRPKWSVRSDVHVERAIPARRHRHASSWGKPHDPDLSGSSRARVKTRRRSGCGPASSGRKAPSLWPRSVPGANSPLGRHWEEKNPSAWTWSGRYWEEKAPSAGLGHVPSDA